MRVICPRPCTSPAVFDQEDHCLGELLPNGTARCEKCGRFMPMEEAIYFDG
jgi:hypothetical protein